MSNHSGGQTPAEATRGAGGGRKVKSAAEANGGAKRTRAGIVGILTVQPARLPVICFVVSAPPLPGGVGGGGGGHDL